MPWPEVGDVYIRTLLNERKKKPLSAFSAIVAIMLLIGAVVLTVALIC